MTKNKSLKITAAAMMATTMSLSAVSVAPATALSMPAIAGSQGLPNYPHPVPHKGAPNPQPFGPEYLGGYISDISSHGYGVYLDVVDGFNDVRANHPGIIKQNLDKVVDMNNAAQKNPAAIKRAQSDARADKDGVLMAFSDALGGELGRHFRDALRENRLPKTQFLLGNGYLARAGGVASSTFVEKMVFNNDRPFVVAPDRIMKYQDGKRDYYGTSKSYPSGHTNQAVWSTTLLALTLPELAPQILARGSEAGHNRIVMGVHYPLDVMGGRMSGTAAAADRWNDPKMRDAIRQAGKELRAELEWRAGRPISQVVKSDKAYRSTDQAVREYTERMSYGFPKIYRKDAPMVVPQAAPDLLLAKFPKLSYNQRASILRQTAIPSGSPLDDQGPRGSWQRLNMAAAFAAKVKVNGDGSVTVLR